MYKIRSEPKVRLALPKGRIQDAVFGLLNAAGIEIRLGARGYRPELSLPGFEAKVQKPQDIVSMLRHGSRDLGFAGRDWVVEKDADLVEILDTGLNPVRIVVAGPEEFEGCEKLPQRDYVVATEYERLARDWIEKNDLDAVVLRTSGATEVFPPEDADLVIDNVSTGATLAANRLVIIEELLRSSTCLFASRAALEEPDKRSIIDGFVLLIRSVLEARQRAMVELNVSEEGLREVTSTMPCMLAPTVSSLGEGRGYAVRAAVSRQELASLIPKLKSCGGTDILVTSVEQIVP